MSLLCHPFPATLSIRLICHAKIYIWLGNNLPTLSCCLPLSSHRHSFAHSINTKDEEFDVENHTGLARTFQPPSVGKFRSTGSSRCPGAALRLLQHWLHTSNSGTRPYSTKHQGFRLQQVYQRSIQRESAFPREQRQVQQYVDR